MTTTTTRDEDDEVLLFEAESVEDEAAERAAHPAAQAAEDRLLKTKRATRECRGRHVRGEGEERPCPCHVELTYGEFGECVRAHCRSDSHIVRLWVGDE